MKPRLILIKPEAKAPLFEGSSYIWSRLQNLTTPFQIVVHDLLKESSNRIMCLVSRTSSRWYWQYYWTCARQVLTYWQEYWRFSGIPVTIPWYWHIDNIVNIIVNTGTDNMRPAIEPASVALRVMCDFVKRTEGPHFHNYCDFMKTMFLGTYGYAYRFNAFAPSIFDSKNLSILGLFWGWLFFLV